MGKTQNGVLFDQPCASYYHWRTRTVRIGYFFDNVCTVRVFYSGRWRTVAAWLVDYQNLTTVDISLRSAIWLLIYWTKYHISKFVIFLTRRSNCASKYTPDRVQQVRRNRLQFEFHQNPVYIQNNHPAHALPRLNQSITRSKLMCWMAMI